ncbi:MAG: hypothetical protein P8144_03390, partial [Gammaproteobacteria bacterium]
MTEETTTIKRLSSKPKFTHAASGTRHTASDTYPNALTQCLVQLDSDFQNVEICHHPHYGHQLVLDGDL